MAGVVVSLLCSRVAEISLSYGVARLTESLLRECWTRIHQASISLRQNPCSSQPDLLHELAENRLAWTEGLTLKSMSEGTPPT